jgi:hypothetical protein
MSRVIGDTIGEFFSVLRDAVGAALPWVVVLIGIAAFWAIRRWLWYDF